MQIKKPVTLRIKDAEILESQLSSDDLTALSGHREDNQGDAVCPVIYCTGGYTSVLQPAELAPNK